MMRFVGIVLMLLLLAACGGSSDGGNAGREGLTEMSQAAVETLVGAPIPDTAQDVNTRGVDWQDDMAVVTFTAPQTDVIAYLDTVGLTGAMEEGVTPFAAAAAPPFADIDWWTIPDLSAEDAIYQGANTTQIETKFYNVLVVPGDDDSATLWLQVLER